MIEGESHSI